MGGGGATEEYIHSFFVPPMCQWRERRKTCGLRFFGVHVGAGHRERVGDELAGLGGVQSDRGLGLRGEEVGGFPVEKRGQSLGCPDAQYLHWTCRI